MQHQPKRKPCNKPVNNHSSVPSIILLSISRSCFGRIAVAGSTPFAHLISPQVFRVGGYFTTPTRPDQSKSIRRPRHSSKSESESESSFRHFDFFTTIMFGRRM